jgi:hypothetical protein
VRVILQKIIKRPAVDVSDAVKNHQLHFAAPPNLVLKPLAITVPPERMFFSDGLYTKNGGVFNKPEWQ